ncbi:MAG: SdiA-regulated domain-containing protein [Thermaurantimonas sp.]|uniref:SdiA-regulated domain-containing protein n=1 Tax=Thermaurantimonas sp. TaxID=2681568 RepID=UPI00391BDA59
MMRYKFGIAVALFVLSIANVYAQKIKRTKIAPYMSHYIEVSEPSGLVYYSNNNSLFIVSDDGDLFETTLDGKILRKAPYEGVDFEAVTVVNDLIYVVEERHRNVLVFDPKDLKLLRTYHIPYSGGRNKGFESIAYIPDSRKFILVTEKDPVYIVELDTAFRQLNIQRFEAARDISSATYFEGFLYLLSDEDRTIFQLSPKDYSIIQAWRVPIINPEGIMFLPDRSLRIISDDREKLYYFKNPNQ